MSTAIRFHSHHEWPIEANWKIVMENFLECYHCPTAHPGFSKVIDVSPDSYLLQVHATFSSQIAPVRASALAGNGKGAYTPSNELAQSQYHFLFPSTTLNIAPGIPNISLERYVPDGLRRTLEVTDYYFGVETSESEIEELMAWDNQVAEEDVSLVAVGAAWARVGGRPAGPPDGGEREAHRRLPASRPRRHRRLLAQERAVELLRHGRRSGAQLVVQQMTKVVVHPQRLCSVATAVVHEHQPAVSRFAIRRDLDQRMGRALCGVELAAANLETRLCDELEGALVRSAEPPPLLVQPVRSPRHA